MVPGLVAADFTAPSPSHLNWQHHHHRIFAIHESAGKNMNYLRPRLWAFMCVSVSVPVSVSNDMYIHIDMYMNIHSFFEHFFGTTPTQGSGGVGDCVCVCAFPSLPFLLGIFQWWKSAVNRHRSRKRETVAFCVSQKWCRILLRGISEVHIVLEVFLRFFLPKAGSVGHQGVRGWGLGEEEFSVRRNLLQRGISALVIVFLCTVGVYTCLCVSLQRDT
jgi:hypothetical protein